MSNNQQQRKPLVKLAGMYENVSKTSGETYFAGYMGNAKVMLFRDKNAEPNKPGWSLCVQEKEQKPDQGQGGGGYGQSQGQPQGYRNQGGYGGGQHRQPPPAQQQQTATAQDDDIPF